MSTIATPFATVLHLIERYSPCAHYQLNVKANLSLFPSCTPYEECEWAASRSDSFTPVPTGLRGLAIFIQKN